MDIPEQVTLRNNELSKQFEWKIEDKLVKIVYDFSSDGKRIFLTHTETHPSLQGTGATSLLTQTVLDYIEEKGWKLVPLCPYVQSYIKKHPQYRKLLDKGISF